jgi:precorrin-2 dehydrogenase/sirohydrochlorin ferrochelatase
MLLPLTLDLTRLRLALIGTGAAAVQRLAWLDEAGAASLVLFSGEPTAELIDAAGARLVRRWPSEEDLARAQLVFIADLAEPQQSALAAAARSAGAIVHVEDAPALTDIHAPAVLRRGDLTIAISTAGAAPGLAGELKGFLGRLFGPEWKGRVDEVRNLRRRWRKAGISHELIRSLTASRLTRYWLKDGITIAANDHSQAITERGGSHVSETR